MAGTQNSIIRKTDFKIPIVSGSASEILLAPLVDTVGWVSGVALWRVFSLTIPAVGGSNVQLIVQNAMTGPDDPNAILVPTADLLTISLTAAVASTSPVLQVSAIPAPIGRYLRVLLRGNYLSGAAGTALLTCAVDLVGRSA